MTMQMAVIGGDSSGTSSANDSAKRQPQELPSLDATGKAHGSLPEAKDLERYSADELRQLQGELKKSVQERIRKTVELGPHKPHGERQAAEQRLIQQMEKNLESR
ncbi:hypothetical protein [Sorangium cellulosum]|nr:hypothetical protein [Sorangium cellulosum]